MTEEAVDSLECSEPSILIDEAILPLQNRLKETHQPEAVQYAVNDATYYADDRIDSEFKQFQVYADRLSNISGSFFMSNGEVDSQFMYCSTSDSDCVEDDPTDDAVMALTIRRVPHGVIVDENVYLTEDQWNCILAVEGGYWCVLCQRRGGAAEGAAHVQEDRHVRAVARCPPLERAGLSIVRRIRDRYHCAVCNETIDLDDEAKHFDSQSHEGNLLSAINKVSDYDLDSEDNDASNTNNDCYHFDANALNNVHQRNENNDNHIDGNVNDDDEFASVDGSFDGDDGEENFDSIWGVPKQRNANTGSSYATMLKKPKILNIPMFLEKEIGNKKVKVRFDSYHMLINPKVNRFYCMVCKEYSHIRFKAEHCNEEAHLVKLEQCRVVDDFGDYFIREMDDKFYHCGHCNNLVLISQMHDHLEERHGKKLRSVSESAKENSPKNSYNDADTRSSVNGDLDTVRNSNSDKANRVTDNGNRNNDIKDSTDANTSNDKNRSNVKERNNNDNLRSSLECKVASPLTEFIVINPFGYKIAVPLLSFNVVLKRQHFNDYYCGLCDIMCVEEHILPHINCITHMQMLQRTPFILPFNCNLIRAIRESLHCAICNLPISVNVIYAHIQDPMHLQLLSRAMNFSAGIYNSSVSNPPNNVQNSVQNPVPPVNNEASKTTTKPLTTEAKEMVLTKKGTELTEEKIELTKKETELTQKETELTQKETDVTIKETNRTDENINLSDELDLLLNDSVESQEFDLEDYVYIKLKNAYYKISLASYNTLVQNGDGTRYCFVCSAKVVDVNKHLDMRSHIENIRKSKFLDKPDGTLLRQLFLMYHCSICNVVVSRSEFKNHLTWPTHVQGTSASLDPSKKSKKNHFKSGVTVHVAVLTKRLIYLNFKETPAKVIFKIRQGSKVKRPVEKKNKVVIVCGDVLKIKFENWNGLCLLDGVWKCHLCRSECTEESLGNHICSDTHRKCLENIKTEYLKHLLRQLTDNTLHCIACNTPLCDKESVILLHINGKRHKSALEDINTFSSQANAYSDCDTDVLHL